MGYVSSMHSSEGKGFLGEMRKRIIRFCKKTEAEQRFYCSILLKKDEVKQGRVDKDTVAEDLIPE